MTTGKTIALARWTFVSKVISLLFNILSRLVIIFLPRSKCLLISWLPSTSAVTLEPNLQLAAATKSLQSCPTLWLHELQHTRPPYPSPSPGVHSNSCPSSRWCHPAISSSVIPFSSCPQIPPSIRVFSNESTLCIRRPKYWSFSFSIIPSKEIPGLVSFRMDWLDLLAVQVYFLLISSI